LTEVWIDRTAGPPCAAAEDPLLTIQEGNALPAEGEASVEVTDVGHVLAELCAEHRERVEAGAP